MAQSLSSTKTNDDGALEVYGSDRVSYGTFTAQTASDDAITSGDIDTGLEYIKCFVSNYYGTTADTQTSGVGIVTSLPASGPNVTVSVRTNKTGTWMAIGR